MGVLHALVSSAGLQLQEEAVGWQVGEVHNQQERTLRLITAVDPETTRPDRDARKDLDGALAAGTGNHSWGPKDRETSL